MWEDFRAENLEIRELPDDGASCCSASWSVKGKASGVEVRTPFGQIAQFRDGMVIRLDALRGPRERARRPPACG